MGSSNSNAGLYCPELQSKLHSNHAWHGPKTGFCSRSDCLPPKDSQLAIKCRLAVLQVGRVELQSCRLIKSERMSAQEINNQASSKQIPQRFAAWLFYLFERLQKLAPGAYLMTHANKAVHATIWQASSLNVKVC